MSGGLCRVVGAVMGGTGAGCMVLADVDVAMPGGGKGRKGRRRRLLRSRRRFGERLLLRGRWRLVGNRLLRRERRGEHPDREGCTEESGAVHGFVSTGRPDDGGRRSGSEDSG